jgi:tryptophan-rich hypothetical protein
MGKIFFGNHLRIEEKDIVACILEAVIRHKEYKLDWKLLKDASNWLPGWR